MTCTCTRCYHETALACETTSCTCCSKRDLIYDGPDVQFEINSVNTQNLGDTVLLWQKGNGNYFGVNQEQSTGIGSYPALRDDNNGNGSIQPGQVNPSRKIICLTIIK